MHTHSTHTHTYDLHPTSHAPPPHTHTHTYTHTHTHTLQLSFVAACLGVGVVCQWDQWHLRAVCATTTLTSPWAGLQLCLLHWWLHYRRLLVSYTLALVLNLLLTSSSILFHPYHSIHSLTLKCEVIWPTPFCILWSYSLEQTPTLL